MLRFHIHDQESKIFIETCPVCNGKQPHIPKLKGAIKPIVSSTFCDCFQADLIDMTGTPCEDWNGTVMKYILYLRDHFTRLTYLRAIPQKSAAMVSSELNYIFGFIGYPVVYHSGMHYDDPMLLTPWSKLRKAQTVSELDSLLGSSEFWNRMIAIGELGGTPNPKKKSMMKTLLKVPMRFTLRKWQGVITSWIFTCCSVCPRM